MSTVPRKSSSPSTYASHFVFAPAFFSLTRVKYEDHESDADEDRKGMEEKRKDAFLNEEQTVWLCCATPSDAETLLGTLLVVHTVLVDGALL